MEPFYFSAIKTSLSKPYTIKDLSNRPFIKTETYTFPLSHTQWQIVIACVNLYQTNLLRVFLCQSCMRIKKLTSKRERTEAICRQQQGYWEGRHFVRHTKDIMYEKGIEELVGCLIPFILLGSEWHQIPSNPVIFCQNAIHEKVDRLPLLYFSVVMEIAQLLSVNLKSSQYMF